MVIGRNPCPCSVGGVAFWCGMLAWGVSSDVGVTQWLRSSPQHGLHSVHARGYCKCMMCPQTPVCLLWFVYNFDIVIITFSRHWLKPIPFNSYPPAGWWSLFTCYSIFLTFCAQQKAGQGAFSKPMGKHGGGQGKSSPQPSLLSKWKWWSTYWFENSLLKLSLTVFFFFFFHGCHFRWFLLWKAAVTHWLRS